MSKLKSILKQIPKHITLIGVTKYSSREEIIAAINEGLTQIGENRVEAIEKISGLNVKKHFIGHIQSNKIKKIVENFDVIQSVSSLKHLTKISEVASELNKKIELFLELKISLDINKEGVSEQELDTFFSKKFSNVKICGFMMMASNTDDKELVREEFRKAKKLFDKYKLKYISMGMSKDYRIAIEEGSNMIRLGSIIFKQK